MSGEVKVCGERGLVTWCGACQNWEPISLVERQAEHVKTGEQVASCGACDKRLPAIKRYKQPDQPELATGDLAGPAWCRKGHALPVDDENMVRLDETGQAWCMECHSHVTPRTEEDGAGPANKAQPTDKRAEAVKLMRLVRDRVAFVYDKRQGHDALGPSVGWLEEAMYLLTGQWPDPVPAKPPALKPNVPVDGLCSYVAGCFSGPCRQERYDIGGGKARCRAAHVTMLADGIKPHRDLRAPSAPPTPADHVVEMDTRAIQESIRYTQVASSLIQAFLEGDKGTNELRTALHKLEQSRDMLTKTYLG